MLNSTQHKVHVDGTGMAPPGSGDLQAQREKLQASMGSLMGTLDPVGGSPAAAELSNASKASSAARSRRSAAQATANPAPDRAKLTPDEVLARTEARVAELLEKLRRGLEESSGGPVHAAPRDEGPHS